MSVSAEEPEEHWTEVTECTCLWTLGDPDFGPGGMDGERMERTPNCPVHVEAD